METVSNLTSAASKAIWGDPNKTENAQGEEPRSGDTGDVSSGEPYDKGNEDPISTSSKTDPTSSTTDTPGIATSTLPIRSEHETDNTGVTSKLNPTSATSTDMPTSKDISGADTFSAADETTSGKHDRIVETKKEADEAAKIDTSTPGPKPLSEAVKTGESAGQDDDRPQTESQGEGTGQKYVTSTGLKSDGGDFDAANPGAAKEADHLLDSKGVHHETPGSTDTSSKTAKEDNDTSESPSGGKLKGLKQKIKAKLHKN